MGPLCPGPVSLNVCRGMAPHLCVCVCVCVCVPRDISWWLQVRAPSRPGNFHKAAATQPPKQHHSKVETSVTVAICCQLLPSVAVLKSHIRHSETMPDFQQEVFQMVLLLSFQDVWGNVVRALTAILGEGILVSAGLRTGMTHIASAFRPGWIWTA